jgi:hypothetical protein
VLHLFCWICFWLLCVEKKEKNNTKQTSNPSSLFSHLQIGPTILPGPTAPRGPPSLSPLFSPALPKAGHEPNLLLRPNSHRRPASPSPSLPLADTAAPRVRLSPTSRRRRLLPTGRPRRRLSGLPRPFPFPPPSCASMHSAPAPPPLPLPFPKPTLHRLHHH